MKPDEAHGPPATVAVIGAGSVGATLARRLAAAGRTVTIGVRHPEASGPQELARELGDGSQATTPAEAVTASGVVIVAIPGAAAGAFVDEHSEHLAGRVVIDATNNLAGGHDSPEVSFLERLTTQVATAWGFRAFNSVGWENMDRPRFGDTTADMFFAGPNDDAVRPVVEALIADVGFRPVYVGAGADAHQAVNSLATLWFALAFGQGRGRRLAFRMLDPDDEQ